ncbi:hypothetical protein JCM10908_006460 [Rhodotorula pacifica]|uniref:uncharacterized protein n=1 Tax=Rhodotorula pacifica TaxID=1495444 RepID=UPI0031751379
MAGTMETVLAEHEVTQSAFKQLETAFEEYRAAEPQRDAYLVTPSTAVFDPLIVSTTVAWPIVLEALIRHFGTTDKSRQEAVDPGRLGFARVMDVLRRTNGFAHDATSLDAAELWLYRLQKAVTDCVAALPGASPDDGVRTEPGSSNAGTPAKLLSDVPSPLIEAEASQQLPTPPLSTSRSEVAQTAQILSPPKADHPRQSRSRSPVWLLNWHFPRYETFDRAAGAPSTEPMPKKDASDDDGLAASLAQATPAATSSAPVTGPYTSARAQATPLTPRLTPDELESDSGRRPTRRGTRALPVYRDVTSSDEDETEDGTEDEYEEAEEGTDDDDLYAGPANVSRSHAGRSTNGRREGSGATCATGSSIGNKRRQSSESNSAPLEAASSGKRARTHADSVSSSEWKTYAVLKLMSFQNGQTPLPIAAPSSAFTLTSPTIPREPPCFDFPDLGAASAPRPPSPKLPDAASALNLSSNAAVSPTNQQATDIGRKIAALFPFAKLPELSARPDAVAPNQVDEVFKRADIGGQRVSSINMGRKKLGTSQIYQSDCDHLTLQAKSNVCLSKSGGFGEPIVLFASAEKCVKYKTALSMDRDECGFPKSRRGSHLFISDRSGQWAYRGIYDLAYDGTGDKAWRLPYGAGASAKIDGYLKGLIENRVRKQTYASNFFVLRAWGWRLPSLQTTYTDADLKKMGKKREDRLTLKPSELWEELETGTIQPVIPFLALQCVLGYDQADWDVWAAARSRRLQKKRR